MPHDEFAAEVGAWLAKARRDLRAAEVDLSAKPPLADDAAFHCQQAAEKALKGLLVFRRKRPAKTHDINAIGSVVVETDPDLAGLLGRAARLTVYAWEFRCPGDLIEPPEDEVREALALARELVDAVEPRTAPAS